MYRGVFLIGSGILVGVFCARAVADDVYQANGIKIGEVTQDTAIVWTRLTASSDPHLPGIEWADVRKPDGRSPVPDGKTLADMEAAVPGANGSVKLSYWYRGSPDEKFGTDWVDVDPQADFTHQFRLTALRPGAICQLAVQCRSADGTMGQVITGGFRTAPAADQSRTVSFMVVTGQDYHRRDDKINGHKIYPLMQALDPDFFIHTGDIEYYDKPRPLATNTALARYKWNRLFGLPFQRDFHNVTASYFIKDDHDTLKNDCWPGQTYGDLTWDEGLAIFKEQVPMGEKTYRTIRWGRDLQVWLVEGRDFRSPNNMADGPKKTIWGEQQKRWFFTTVEASDATFKILISPTPLVGPDRTNKGDNHANNAFAHEGKQLREFIGGQQNMFICCGDRHWQYVSVDPVTGVREFSCGPTSDKHAGGWSNDKRSSMHKYLNVVGGFLSVTVDSASASSPVAIFRHYGTDGKLLNEDRQESR
jgi:alkaline phosphatase D